MRIQVKDISETSYGFYNGEGWSLLFIDEPDLCLEDKAFLGLPIDEKYSAYLDADHTERNNG